MTLSAHMASPWPLSPMKIKSYSGYSCTYSMKEWYLCIPTGAQACSHTACQFTAQSTEVTLRVRAPCQHRGGVRILREHHSQLGQKETHRDTDTSTYSQQERQRDRSTQTRTHTLCCGPPRVPVDRQRQTDRHRQSDMHALRCGPARALCS